MCLPPLLATAWSWSSAYRQHWKSISEPEAVRMAHAEMIRYIQQMRAEGANYAPPESWQLTSTNPPLVGWRGGVKVILPKVGLQTIGFRAYRGSNGWVAVEER